MHQMQSVARLDPDDPCGELHTSGTASDLLPLHHSQPDRHLVDDLIEERVDLDAVIRDRNQGTEV